MMANLCGVNVAELSLEPYIENKTIVRKCRSKDLKCKEIKQMNNGDIKC